MAQFYIGIDFRASNRNAALGAADCPTAGHAQLAAGFALRKTPCVIRSDCQNADASSDR